MSDVAENAPAREEAIARLKAKRAFQISLATYVLVNAVVIVIWLVSREDGDGFWPIWVLLFWGLGLVGQGWHAYGPGRRAITEGDIQREMRRQRP